MKKLLLTLPALVVTGACWSDDRSAGPELRDYPIAPVLFTEVSLGDGFGSRRVETNRIVAIPFVLEQNEITGRLDNFLKAAGRKEGYTSASVTTTPTSTKFSRVRRLRSRFVPTPRLDRYLDVLERVLYNGLIVASRRPGRRVTESSLRRMPSSIRNPRARGARWRCIRRERRPSPRGGRRRFRRR